MILLLSTIIFIIVDINSNVIKIRLSTLRIIYLLKNTYVGTVIMFIVQLTRYLF